MGKLTQLTNKLVTASVIVMFFICMFGATLHHAVLPPTPPKPPEGAAADLFALYLRPRLVAEAAATTDSAAAFRASFWATAARLQRVWGGLHVTLCSFRPKLSAGVPGHHGGSLRQLQQATAAQLRAQNGAVPWRLVRPLRWYVRNGEAMVALASEAGEGAEPSATLRAIATAVHSHGMVNARTVQSFHLTLGRVDQLPDPQGAFAYPPEGAAPQLMPPVLAEGLRLASWALVITKLRGGQPPAADNETEEV